jgi:hypothetical protein
MFFTPDCKKKSVYEQERYWYHASTSLSKKREHLLPWNEVEGSNRGGDEPAGNRICVSPSIEQCITAIPYYYGSVFTIYRTADKIRASKPFRVYDAHITMEGWIEIPMDFVKVGKLKFADIEKSMEIENVIDPCASEDNLDYTKKVLRWWKHANLQRFVKKT